MAQIPWLLLLQVTGIGRFVCEYTMHHGYEDQHRTVIRSKTHRVCSTCHTPGYRGHTPSPNAMLEPTDHNLLEEAWL